jgi:hypothetical protein
VPAPVTDSSTFPPPPSETVTAGSDTALGHCVTALRPPADREQAVITAVRTAYGLEGDLYRRSDSITSWDQVYSHYRSGFGEQLARQLAEYSWDSTSGMLRPTHSATVVPDSVGVLKLKADEALVAWIPPTALRQSWGLPRCVVDRAVREGGRWVVSGRTP